MSTEVLLEFGSIRKLTDQEAHSLSVGVRVYKAHGTRTGKSNVCSANDH